MKMTDIGVLSLCLNHDGACLLGVDQRAASHLGSSHYTPSSIQCTRNVDIEYMLTGKRVGSFLHALCCLPFVHVRASRELVSSLC